MDDYILEFSDLAKKDAPAASWQVAMLGELNQHMLFAGLRIPEGFVLTKLAYDEFLLQNQLPRRINSLFQSLDPNDLSNLSDVGTITRALIRSGEFPYRIQVEIISAFQILQEKIGTEKPLIVKCTATTGKEEECTGPGCEKIIMNTENEDSILEAFVDCYASVFSDEVIERMVREGRPLLANQISIQVHRLIRSDLSCSGTCFTWPSAGQDRSYVMLLSEWGLPDLRQFDLEQPDYYFAEIDRNETNIRIGPIESLMGTKSHSLVIDGPDKHLFQQRTHKVPVAEEQRKVYTLSESEARTLIEWTLQAESVLGEPVTLGWSKDGPEGALYLDLVEHPEKGNQATGKWVLHQLPKTGA